MSSMASTHCPQLLCFRQEAKELGHDFEAKIRFSALMIDIHTYSRELISWILSEAFICPISSVIVRYPHPTVPGSQRRVVYSREDSANDGIINRVTLRIMVRHFDSLHIPWDLIEKIVQYLYRWKRAPTPLSRSEPLFYQLQRLSLPDNDPGPE